jgi:hypothetical protein
MQDVHPDAAKLLLPALNAMIDMVYVILNLEFPCLGLLQIEAFGQALMDLLQSLK